MTVKNVPEQPMRALEQANRVRLARARLKREVADGSRSAAWVIAQCPWEAERMSLGELLMSQRRWGRSRCRRLLIPLELGENKSLGSLTSRQRTLLERTLTERVPSRHPVERPLRQAVGSHSPAPA